VSFLENPDFAGVEAVELAKGVHRTGHDWAPIVDFDKYYIDSVKY
jgi:hypothetical protein